jgi:hypothetical protein
MKIYIGNYWVPFPSSEYGGSWTVVAENSDEVFKMLKELTNYSHKPYDDEIKAAIDGAAVFDLDPAADYKSQVVDTFFT